MVVRNRVPFTEALSTSKDFQIYQFQITVPVPIGRVDFYPTNMSERSKPENRNIFRILYVCVGESMSNRIIEMNNR